MGRGEYVLYLRCWEGESENGEKRRRSAAVKGYHNLMFWEVNG